MRLFLELLFLIAVGTVTVFGFMLLTRKDANGAASEASDRFLRRWRPFVFSAAALGLISIVGRVLTAGH